MTFHSHHRRKEFILGSVDYTTNPFTNQREKEYRKNKKQSIENEKEYHPDHSKKTPLENTVIKPFGGFDFLTPREYIQRSKESQAKKQKKKDEEEKRSSSHSKSKKEDGSNSSDDYSSNNEYSSEELEPSSF